MADCQGAVSREYGDILRIETFGKHRPILEVLLLRRSYYHLVSFFFAPATLWFGVLSFFFIFCLYIQLIKTDSGISGLHKFILGIDYIHVTNQYDTVRLYDNFTL